MSFLRPLRWERCILNRGSDAANFFREHLKQRKVLLISGAGFDPRTLEVPRLLVEVTKRDSSLEAILIRERRPSPDGDLLAAAEAILSPKQTASPQECAAALSPTTAATTTFQLQLNTLAVPLLTNPRLLLSRACPNIDIALVSAFGWPKSPG
jgi:hypothetical protein